MAPSTVFLAPPNIDGYDRHKEPNAQPASVPQVFLDAMRVRQAVFVEEQHVPLDVELDCDDPRSCHWVAYGVPTVEGSGSAEKPLGTIRLVPYPQEPHPVPGGIYATVDGVYGLQEVREGKPAAAAVAGTAATHDDDDDDGGEPYVKLGRLAVVRASRGQRIGQLLVQTALDWIRTHPDYFDQPDATCQFKGLVIIHAQTQAAEFWKRAGFTVDESMGEWWEEGMAHVGMRLRLDIATNAHS